MKDIVGIGTYCNVDRDGYFDESGICLKFAEPMKTVFDLEIITSDHGKVEIYDNSKSLTKEDFLDLMSKLYDMAEVK